jgi:DNA-binding HxlR family transcriptional regulator
MAAKRIVSLCPIEELLVLIGGRWKPVILWWLLSNKVPLRFTILRAKMPRISQKVLTQQLRELERDGLIKRQMFAEMPVRVVVNAVWTEAAPGSPGARFLGQKAHTATEGRDTVL